MLIHPDLPWPDVRDRVVEIARTTTPSQRLAWLEEMLDLAYGAGALDKARRLEQAETRARFASPSTRE